MATRVLSSFFAHFYCRDEKEKKVRRVFLSLHRRKKYKPTASKSSLQKVTSPWKTTSVTSRKTPYKTPASFTACEGSSKRLLTPGSSSKKGRKKVKSSPFKLVGEEAGENIIFDEFEEEAKSFIDIATDSQVIEEITKAGCIHYFIEFFQLVNH